MSLRADQVVITDSRYGRMMHLAHDEFIGRSLIELGEYCEGEVECFGDYVQLGDLVVDAGANIGPHTLALASLVGPQGAVLAFEPVPLFFQMLAGNVALNALMNVRTFPYALGAEHGTVRIPLVDYGAPDSYGGVYLGAEQGEPIPMMPLDTLALPRLALLKIDVEGMEQRVLEGAVNTIQGYHPVLYVENNVSEDVERAGSLVTFIRRVLDYELYWHTPAVYRPDNERGNPINPFPGMVGQNMIGLHKSQKPLKAYAYVA